MEGKQTMQDMIPPEKRTIRRVSLSGRVNKHESIEESAHQQFKKNDSRIPPPLKKRKKNEGGRRWPRILFWILGVLLLLFVLLSSFPRSSISITSRQEKLTVSGTFTAATDNAIGVMPYELFTITRDGEEVVDVVGEKFVEAKSSGTIIVFNDFDKNNQRLVANTRFETSEGLVYKTQDPITVPGQTVDEDGKIVPGSIETRVVADEPGEKYNIELSDFTLPGLKESGDEERFAAFFGRSKTPMTGGFAGVQKTIDEEKAQRAQDSIDASIREELLNALDAELPDGFITYPDNIFITFKDLPQANTENDNEVILRRRGTLTAVVFDENKFASFIAENTSAIYDRGIVALEDSSTLTFTMVNVEEFVPNLSNQFEFNLNGQTTLVWKLDEEQLKNDLAGKHRRDITIVLSGYPSIEKVDITIYPFWRRTFPENTKNLKIEYKSPNKNG